MVDETMVISYTHFSPLGERHFFIIIIIELNFIFENIIKSTLRE